MPKFNLALQGVGGGINSNIMLELNMGTSKGDDITNAVLMAISTMQTGQGKGENIELNIDGQNFARLILPEIKRELSRQGVKLDTI